MKDKFLYLEQFMTALEDLEEEDKYRATYVLCYYGLYREFPEEATAIDKMYVKANAKLFEGQDAYIEKQTERGKQGGRPTKVTDEMIIEEIKKMKEEGLVITSDALGKRVGMSAAAIRKRDPWKDKDKIMLGEKDPDQDDIKASISAFNF